MSNKLVKKSEKNKKQKFVANCWTGDCRPGILAGIVIIVLAVLTGIRFYWERQDKFEDIKGSSQESSVGDEVIVVTDTNFMATWEITGEDMDSYDNKRVKLEGYTVSNDSGQFICRNLEGSDPVQVLNFEVETQESMEDNKWVSAEGVFKVREDTGGEYLVIVVDKYEYSDKWGAVEVEHLH